MRFVASSTGLFHPCICVKGGKKNSKMKKAVMWVDPSTLNVKTIPVPMYN